MTPAQFRNQHGDPATWTAADFDSFQVIAENTWRSRLTFQVHAVFRAVRKTAQAIHHLSTNPIVTTVGIAVAVFLWLAAPTAVAAAFTPIGLFLSLAWAIDGNENTCPICRHSRKNSAEQAAIADMPATDK
ncbi:hypothetical protein [Streptomyces sp. NPDC005167]